MPTVNQRHVPLYWALGLRLLPLPGVDRFLVRSDYHVDSNREALAEMALAVPGVTHLLWWDDDIWPPMQGVAALTRWHYPVVSGVYRDRQGRSNLMAWTDATHQRVQRLDPPGPGQVRLADAVGLGWCLVDVRVLRRTPKPWFQYAATFGEDAWFWHQVSRVWRLPILVDGDAACGHDVGLRLNAANQAEPIWSGLGTVLAPEAPA